MSSQNKFQGISIIKDGADGSETWPKLAAELLAAFPNIELRASITTEQALSLIGKGLPRQTGIDLFISPYEGEGPRLLSSLNSRTGAPYRCVFVSTADEPLPDSTGPTRIAYLKADDLEIHLVPSLRNVLDAEISPEVEQRSEYSPIRVPLLVAASPMQCDVYISLSAEKYLKLFSVGDVFDPKDLEKYHLRKGIEFLYLKNKDLPDFTRRASKLLIEGYIPPDPAKGTPDPVVEQRRHAFASRIRNNPDIATESFKEIADALGFTKDVQALAHATVQSAVRFAKRKPKLAQLLSGFERDPARYIPVHSHLVAQIGCLLAEQMDWKSAATYQKITFAALMHDVLFKNQELAGVRGLADLSAASGRFSEDETAFYRNHPALGARLCRTFEEIPPDVDTMILEHHERPDGTGFPRGLTHARITPLSALFIVAHDLVDYLMDQEAGVVLNKSLLKDFITLHSDEYDKGNFKKALRIVDTLEP